MRYIAIEGLPDEKPKREYLDKHAALDESLKLLQSSNPDDLLKSVALTNHAIAEYLNILVVRSRQNNK